MPEAPLVREDGGLVPSGPGWFVVNASDARWWHTPQLGSYCPFEGRGQARFPEVGFNLNVLQPGQPSCMYHEENAQEGFVVLAGEAILVIEGEERPLGAWDVVHCPAGTPHVIVGAGTGPCVFLALGYRPPEDGGSYPVDPAALRHAAGVERETRSSEEAYAAFPRPVPGPAPPGWPPAP